MHTSNAILCFGIFLIQVLSSSLIEAVPRHHRDVAYSPLINFLKALRRARSYDGPESSILSIKDGNSVGAEAQGNSEPTIRVGVNSGSTNTVKDSTDARLEETLQQISDQLPTKSPYPIDRVNRALRVLLGGVNTGSIPEILRGSFIFTTNENVRSVANTVIDTLFGLRRDAGDRS